LKRYVEENQLNELVNKNTTINGKELSNDITLSLEDIGLTSENWTFTLADGTTTTKQVVIK